MDFTSIFLKNKGKENVQISGDDVIFPKSDPGCVSEAVAIRISPPFLTPTTDQWPHQPSLLRDRTISLSTKKSLQNYFPILSPNPNS